MSGTRVNLMAESVHEIPPPPQFVQPSVTPAPKKQGKLQVNFKAYRSSGKRSWEGIARQIQTIEEYGLDDANAYDAVFSWSRSIGNMGILRSK